MSSKLLWGYLLGIFPCALFTIQAVRASSNQQTQEVYADKDLMLFDFTTVRDVNDWVEQSDIVRTVGMSKAVLALQKTHVFQRAIFFTLLNPQPNGAGFAGMRTSTNLDLHNYDRIKIHARGQGSNSGYKVVLRHKHQDEEPNPTYEHMFTAPMDSFQTAVLMLSDFKPFYRGRELNSTEAEPLDTSQITNFGLQVYGGVYLPVKQAGSSALEINWIMATN